MRTASAWVFLIVATCLAAVALGQATTPAPITSGWILLKEGQAEGTIEADARNPTNPSPHLLKISVTKYPDLGKGRLGAKNTNTIAVKDGAMYDITFNGTKEGTSSYGVGLVFSLETDDGKVLARTTLPEIGRSGGRRGGGAAGGAWPSYLVNLRARGTAANAHLTVTAIEPFPVWLDNIVIVERPSAQ